MAKNIFYPIEMHNSSFVMTNLIVLKVFHSYFHKKSINPKFTRFRL